MSSSFVETKLPCLIKILEGADTGKNSTNVQFITKFYLKKLSNRILQRKVEPTRIKKNSVFNGDKKPVKTLLNLET